MGRVEKGTFKVVSIDVNLEQISDRWNIVHKE